MNSVCICSGDALSAVPITVLHVQGEIVCDSVVQIVFEALLTMVYYACVEQGNEKYQQHVEESKTRHSYKRIRPSYPIFWLLGCQAVPEYCQKSWSWYLICIGVEREGYNGKYERQYIRIHITLGPFIWFNCESVRYGLSIPLVLWDIITHLISTVGRLNRGVRAWINNYSTLYYMDVIT